MIKAIIYDCFGVLITDKLQELRDEVARHDPAAADEMMKLVRAANKGILEPEVTRPQIAALCGMTAEQYRAYIVGGEGRNKPLFRHIETLKPQYKIGMLSNIGKRSLQNRFSEEELVRYFDAVVASGDIGYAKPELEAYRIAVKRLGVEPEETIFIDDRAVFCAAAEQAGLKAIEYTDFAQYKRDLQTLLADKK
jgi:HAD superfamily hydrolase (TIGR01509 family)